MRTMWRPSDFLVFRPDSETIVTLLPRVKQIDLKFYEISRDRRFEPPLAEEMRLFFDNGETLVIEGYMLWKFRDMIPKQLGDESTGYNDHHRFGDEYGEALMRKVRAAYDAMFVEDSEQSFKLRGRRPIRATLYLTTRRVDTEWRSVLRTEVAQSLGRVMKDMADKLEGVDVAIAGLVEDETSRPQFDLEWVDKGNNMLGRGPVERPWPALDGVPFESFLKMLSKRTHEKSPAHLSVSDLFVECLARFAPALTEDALRVMRKLDPDVYASIAEDLEAKSARAMPKTLAAKLQESDTRFLAEDVLYSLWTRRLATMSLAEVMNLPQRVKRLRDNLSAMGKGYSMVITIGLFPDFSEVEAGRAAAPYTNHSSIDFDSLLKVIRELFMQETFRHIRIADDSIDQVTLHFRGDDGAECRDFGELLLRRSLHTVWDVIPTRDAWSGLHHLNDRNHCPPPVLVPLVVRCEDFEEAMLCIDQFRIVLGMKSAVFASDPHALGRLPVKLHQALEKAYGAKYKFECFLARIAEDERPDRYRVLDQLI